MLGSAGSSRSGAGERCSATCRTPPPTAFPKSQRGKVAGLTGFATQVAPVIGVIPTIGVTGNALLLFLIPGHRRRRARHPLRHPGARGRQPGAPERHIGPSAGCCASTSTTRPSTPTSRWNWAGRFLFYFGLTLNTTFTAFFFASRLGMQVTEVAGIIATLGGVGVLAVTAGALGGGFLSDRFRRRKVFVVTGGALMAVGMVLMAVSSDLSALFAGSLIVSTGIGMFSAVDQALLLDVLPEKATDAGRFMGITGFATSIPQSVAPLIASAILLVGVTGDEKNYSLLFFIAAGLVLAGGLVILRIRSVR